MPPLAPRLLAVLALPLVLAACAGNGGAEIPTEAPASPRLRANDDDPPAQAPAVLPAGELGAVGAFRIRLANLSRSGAEPALITATALVTNDSASAAAAPLLVAICQTGVEREPQPGPSRYRPEASIPAGAQLRGALRFELPPDCAGDLIVEARAGDARVAWRIEPAQRATALAAAELPDALARALEQERRRYNITGAALAVSGPELELWVGASGLADRDTGRPVAPDSVFRIGDVTHTFIAAAALQLVEEGLLDLDAPLDSVFPSLPKSGQISLRRLLNHTSGINAFKIRPFAAAFFSDLRRTWAPEEVLAFLTPLNVDEPGSGWDHATTNYLLVARLVEAATGLPLQEVVRRRFLEPLGLRHTAWLQLDDPTPSLVRSYSKFADREIAQEGYTAWHTAFGDSWGMVSSAGDLARWMRALFGGELLAPQSVVAARDFVKGPGDIEAGLGIYAWENAYGPGLGYLSQGSGYLALAIYLPNEDLSIALLMNQTDAPTTRLTTAVLNALLGEPPALDATDQEAS